MKNKSEIKWQSSWIFNFLIQILILVVIFLIPTIFDRRLGIVFSGTKTTWMRVFGLLILGVWAIKLIITKKHRFIRTALDWPVLSFLLCTTIATLTSVHVYTSVAGFYGRYEGLTTWYLFGLFFFVITNYLNSFEHLKKIIVTVASASTLMALYSIIQRHEWDPYMWGGVVTWQRVIGTIGQPNFLAAYMLMAFFLVLALFLMDKKLPQGEDSLNWYDHLYPVGYFLFGLIIFILMIYNLESYNVFLWYAGFALVTISALLFTFSYDKLHPKVLNCVLGFSLVINYVCILYTQSRGGYIGLFTGSVLFVIVAGRKWIFANWKKIAILGGVIVLISAVTMLRPEYSPFARFASEVTTEKTEKAITVEEKEDGIESEKQIERKLELKGAAGSRGETWKSAFAIIADYPIFGIGPEVLKMVFPRYETELFRFKEAFHVKQDRCHNEIFDVGVTKGLVTFIIYLWLLIVFFRQGFSKARDAQSGQKLMLAGLLAAALSFLIQNQFSFGVVAITSLFWVMWAMVMVIGKGEAPRQSSGQGVGIGEGEEGKELKLDEIPWIPVAVVFVLIVSLIYLSFFSFRADVLFKAGKTKMQMRRLPEASVDLEESLKVYPFEGGTVSHLGIVYLNLANVSTDRKENVNKAIQILKYGTLIDPYNADNFYLLAKIHLMLSRFGDRKMFFAAKKYAATALKIDPYYAEVYHLRGSIKETEGDFDEAAANYEKAFFVNPNLIESMRSLEMLNKKRGKPGETLKVFEKALKQYDDNLMVLERVGILYLEKGQVKKVLEIANKMISLDPENSGGYILRSMVYLRTGKVDQAFSDLQDILMKDPRNILARGQLARVYLVKGNKARAKEEFEQILRLDPNNAFAKNMLKRL